MLMMGIALIFLVIGGVGTMYLVMQENAEVADEVVVVSAHVNERVKEDVAITRDAGGGIELHNKGPEVEILEYRVLDDDGALLRVCQAEYPVGASQKEIINSADRAFKTCWEEYNRP